MNYKKSLFAALLFCLPAAQPLYAQPCDIVRNSDFSAGTASLFDDIDATNMQPWVNNTGSPQLYPNTTIYMWAIPGNTGSESIRQTLCNSVIAGPVAQVVDLSVKAQTNANNSGTMQVLLSDGVNSFVVMNTALTTTMATYTATNIMASLPAGTYNQIIIRPAGAGLPPNNRMDIIIDSVTLSAPGIITTGNRYLVDMVCCQPGVLNFPGPLIVGSAPPQWIDAETGAVLGTGISLPVTPGKSGGMYLFRQSSVNCAGNPCVVQTDTVVVRCCGGDNDWVFIDPARITAADQLYRTGDVKIGNIAVVPGAPDIAKVEIKHNDNSKWGEFILNGGGNGRLLRLKGGFTNGTQSLFQVEANGATDYTEDNVRMMVRADGRVGINTTTPRGRLDVNGDTWNTSGVWQTSDKRYKQNIEQIQDPLSLIAKINGYRYDFRKEEFPEANFRPGKQIGFIAQELKEVLPEAVAVADDGYMGVSYDMMIPVLTEAVKDLKKQVDALRKQLQQQTTGIQGGIDDGIPGAVLYQNAPNPFSTNTGITYELPEKIKDAGIEIHDMTGKTLRSIPVKSGKGNVTVAAGELSPGIYLYSLHADGHVIDTKRMVITK